MKKIILLTLAVLVMMAGCTNSPTPVASGSSTSYQHFKILSAQQWEVTAEDVAQRIKNSLKATFPNAVVKPSIFIRYTKDYEKIPFGKAFYHLLRSKLVQKGVVVLNDMGYKDTLLLDYDMQVVQHLPDEANTEVVISTTMTLRQQFIFGDSRVYYISSGDFNHYENNGRNFTLVGCAERSTCPGQ